jgi:hypothetical protein
MVRPYYSRFPAGVNGKPHPLVRGGVEWLVAAPGEPRVERLRKGDLAELIVVCPLLLLSLAPLISCLLWEELPGQLCACQAIKTNPLFGRH